MMDRLESSFQQATRFSADASHELKTPLAVMQGELENALQSATPGSAEQRVFANLVEEAQRLKTITRSLLLLAEADAGQLPLTMATVNLSALLGELIEDIEVLATEFRIKVAVDIAPNLQVCADGSLLRQAVLNLLHNAIRYNEPAGWITITLAARNDQIELDVCNGGPGIPTADQPRLFDRFFRADAARSRQVDGVGLGLSLAREIARAHQGTLTLQQSQPGRTCFSLALPGQTTRPALPS
jgi:signal transduction histidine kinase